MCGRFYLPEDELDDDLALLLSEAEAAEAARLPGFRLKRGEICPGDAAVVLALSRGLRMRAFVMQWGFHLEKRLIFNARAETAAEKPMFRDSMKTRRCVIPASGYFEWDHRQAKPPKYLFVPESGHGLYLAGLYRFEPGMQRPVFTILTRDAAPAIAAFHSRMPVILPREQLAAWLDHDTPAEAILPLAEDRLAWKKAT